MLLLPHLLRRFIRNGRLILIDHTGSRRAFGSGENGPAVTIRLTDANVERELFFNPELAAAEAYMDGRLVPEDGSAICDVLAAILSQSAGLGAHPVQQGLRKVWRALRSVHQSNPRRSSVDNASHHYDFPPEFYALWLDPPLNYSCAYFTDPDNTLEQAQRDKTRHIAAKLGLQPGMTVAEIGWDGAISRSISPRPSVCM